MDAGLAQVAKIVLVLLDLLVAPGKIQRHLRHIVQAAARSGAAADVIDLDAGRLRIARRICVKLSALAVSGVAPKAHVFHADLGQEQQVVIGRIGLVRSGDLDARGYRCTVAEALLAEPINTAAAVAILVILFFRDQT